MELLANVLPSAQKSPRVHQRELLTLLSLRNKRVLSHSVFGACWNSMFALSVLGFAHEALTEIWCVWILKVMEEMLC